MGKLSNVLPPANFLPRSFNTFIKHVTKSSDENTQIYMQQKNYAIQPHIEGKVTFPFPISHHSPQRRSHNWQAQRARIIAPFSFRVSTALSGEGNGNPLQYSYLEKPMNRGASQATVHGVSDWDTTEPLSLSKMVYKDMNSESAGLYKVKSLKSQHCNN